MSQPPIAGGGRAVGCGAPAQSAPNTHTGDRAYGVSFLPRDDGPRTNGAFGRPAVDGKPGVVQGPNKGRPPVPGVVDRLREQALWCRRWALTFEPVGDGLLHAGEPAGRCPDRPAVGPGGAAPAHIPSANPPDARVGPGTLVGPGNFVEVTRDLRFAMPKR